MDALPYRSYPSPPPVRAAAREAEGAWVRRIDAAEVADAPAAVRQLVDNASAGGVSLEFLYGAYACDGRLAAAVLMVPQAGGTGLVFASRPRRHGDIPALAMAIDTCCERAPRERVKLAQALVARVDHRQREALTRAGFWPLADLAYMQAQVRVASDLPPAVPGVELREWDASRAPQFTVALESSYRQTLDCPRLQGLRDTEDVLRGHRATGVFDPRLWTLALIGGRPAAVMMLNRVPSARCVELVYLGIAPEHRGRGLGTALMGRAMRLCAERGESCITLAVDTSNAPAVALYRRFRFRRTATKTAMVRCFTRNERNIHT